MRAATRHPTYDTEVQNQEEEKKKNHRAQLSRYIAREFPPDFRRFTRSFTSPPTVKVLSHLAAKWRAFERALYSARLDNDSAPGPLKIPACGRRGEGEEFCSHRGDERTKKERD